MLMNLMTDRNNFIAVVVDRAADFGVGIHMQVCSSNARYRLTSTEAVDYPTRCASSLVEAYFFHERDEARLGP
jgi:hypothetical protein